MADPCFREVGAKVFDYPAFERLLKEIIKDSGYPEERVVRWEMTGQKSLDRAGGIEQFWESHPGDRHEARGEFFISTWMYFDTNGDHNAYEVYTKADKCFHLKKGVTPKAIIAGTFELSTEFWYDRNILGRLLAVAIGAANQGFQPDKRVASIQVISQWREFCDILGFGDIICDTDGGPVIATSAYHNKWQQGWTVWKKDICDRLTNTVEFRSFKPPTKLEETVTLGNNFFWNEFPLELPPKGKFSKPTLSLSRSLNRLQQHSVPHTGVILDAVSAMPTISRLESIITDYMGKMGFNLAQLRLVSNFGFVAKPAFQPELAQSLISGRENPLYTLTSDLGKLVRTAASVGVSVMPEISVSTDAGGWVKDGMLANCPEHYCTGKGVPHDINNPMVMPVIYSVVGELRRLFTSKFFHLGTDERLSSMTCFDEAKAKPLFDVFEHKLEILMALADLSPDDIIRTENEEGVHYPDRTGRVTQYRAGVFDGIRRDEQFFLTIDLFDGDGYAIFKQAKKAASLQPLGVLAELRKLTSNKFNEWKIPHRLLAFAMGISELGSKSKINDSSSFEKTFTELCKTIKLDAADCSPPGDFDQVVAVITETEEFTKKACDFITKLGQRRTRKKVKPFYEVEIKATG